MDSGTYFGGITGEAQKLLKAERQPGFNPTDFDFTTVLTCSFCRSYIEGKKLSCSACKAPIYCSKEVRLFTVVVSELYPRVFATQCATKDYRQSVVPGAQTHAQLCKDNQVSVLSSPTRLSIDVHLNSVISSVT